MDWNYLKYIETIAWAGSLSKAAKHLGIDTSTLSRYLQKIETEHHVKIFKRDGNRYTTTPAGIQWVRCAETVRSKVDELVFAHGGRMPSISLTSLEIFLNHYLLPRIGHFSEKLEFIGADRTLDLPRREADIAIRFSKPTTGDLIVQKLFTAAHAIYVHKDFGKSYGSDMQKFRWVTLNDEFANIEDVRWFRENLGDDAVAYKTSSCEQILTLLRSAPVLAILPCYMGDKHKDLMTIQFHDKKIIFKRDAWLVFHRELSSQKHIKDFIVKLRQLVKHDEKLFLGN